jgi:hypothetical protein
MDKLPVEILTKIIDRKRRQTPPNVLRTISCRTPER